MEPLSRTSYELVSKQYYETYVNRGVMTGGHCAFSTSGGSNTSEPHISMRSSASFHVGDRSDARWRLERPQLEWWWQEGFMGDVTFSNHALFNLFHGILSPTEVSVVLMHALSSDTRVIYVCTLAVFDSMDYSFQDVELDEWMFSGEEDEDAYEAGLDAVEDWRRSLPGV